MTRVVSLVSGVVSKVENLLDRVWNPDVCPLVSRGNLVPRIVGIFRNLVATRLTLGVWFHIVPSLTLSLHAVRLRAAALGARCTATRNLGGWAVRVEIGLLFHAVANVDVEQGPLLSTSRIGSLTILKVGQRVYKLNDVLVRLFNVIIFIYLKKVR